VFSKAQGVPGVQADCITGNSNWTRTNIKAELNASVYQAKGHKIASGFVLTIV